jgi:hypothetical protein
MPNMTGDVDSTGSLTRMKDDDTADAPTPAPRSLAGAAASFAASMARFAASGFKTVDEPLHQLRMGHCQACEYHPSVNTWTQILRDRKCAPACDWDTLSTGRDSGRLAVCLIGHDLK